MTLINGQPAYDVPSDDRGLAYGDGVFETLTVIAGEPSLWTRHYDRLSAGCQLLGFSPPDSSVLLDDIAAAAGEDTVVARITISRGSGGRGYRAPAEAQPRRIISVAAFPDHPIGYWRDGVAVRTCATHLPYRPALAGSKHLNRLEQVLARSEWDDPGVPEGLMWDPDGQYLVEGTMTNLFVRYGDELQTPPVRGYGVEGVMRSEVMAERAAAGYPVRETSLTQAAILGADEVFLTNSVIGLWPVRELDGQGLSRDWRCSRELLARLTGRRAMLDWLGEGS
jgi:4-amino-4-deoxychorismate lyase